VRAGRIAPEVLIQTFSPEHEVLQAAADGNPAAILGGERIRREMLGLPPFGALAVLSGTGADEIAAQLGPDVGAGSGIAVGGDGDGRFLVRAADWMSLGRALNAVERPAGSRVRIEVDPARL